MQLGKLVSATLSLILTAGSFAVATRMGATVDTGIERYADADFPGAAAIGGRLVAVVTRGFDSGVTVYDIDEERVRFRYDAPGARHTETERNVWSTGLIRDRWLVVTESRRRDPVAWPTDPTSLPVYLRVIDMETDQETFQTTLFSGVSWKITKGKLFVQSNEDLVPDDGIGPAIYDITPRTGRAVAVSPEGAWLLDATPGSVLYVTSTVQLVELE